MSANATRGDFVFDYVSVEKPRRRLLGGHIAMLAMIVLLLAALATTVAHGRTIEDAAQDGGTTEFLQGP